MIAGAVAEEKIDRTGWDQQTWRAENTPDARVEIFENGLKFRVDVLSEQKTGFYVDQRFNRQRIARLCAGREVLNCFCYTGAFSVAALASTSAGGAIA